MSEETNAKIEGTMLGIEDHGVLIFWVYLDYGGTSQGFGGYVLDQPLEDGDGKFLKRQGTAFGTEAIMRLLNTVGVGTWEKLPGTPVRVRGGGWKGSIDAIGHYLKDKWFSLSELAEEYKADGHSESS